MTIVGTVPSTTSTTPRRRSIHQRNISAGVDPRTSPYATLLLRITLGVVFVAHALLKLVVLTLPGTATFFADHGFPGWTAYFVFAAELIGGLALVLGIVPRLAALLLVPVLLGAFTVHWPNGWYFAASHGGWEYIAVLIAALLAQVGLGDGPLALVASSRIARPTTSGDAGDERRTRL